MSKAKELARAIKKETHNYLVSPSLRQLVDAVLSEPKPELRGWIEVGEKPYRKLISTTTERIYREGSYRHNMNGFKSNPNEIHILLDAGKDYENLEISFDDFKQKIKEAS